MNEKIAQIKDFIIAHKKPIIIAGLLVAAGTVAYIAIKKARQNKSRR